MPAQTTRTASSAASERSPNEAFSIAAEVCKHLEKNYRSPWSPNRPADPQERTVVLPISEHGDPVLKCQIHEDFVTNAVALTGGRAGSYDAVIGHKGTHSDREWELDATAIYFPTPYPPVQGDQAPAPSKPRPGFMLGNLRLFSASPQGYLHLGFVMHWLAIRSPVIAALREATKGVSSPKILVAGHSLGSGTAQASLLELANWFPEAQFDVVIFGAPRAGTLKWTENVIKDGRIKVWRVVYENDLVTAVPWDFWLGGFHHIPGPWLRLDGPSEKPPNGGFNWRVTNNLFDQLRQVTDWSLSRAKANHNFADNYYPTLQSYLNNRLTDTGSQKA